jgi:hypothetical protein
MQNLNMALRFVQKVLNYLMVRPRTEEDNNRWKKNSHWIYAIFFT